MSLALFLIFLAPQATHAFDEKAQKPAAAGTTLRAGVARVEITDHDAGPVNDPSYVKALAISNGDTTAIIVTVDAVAIGGIGRIGNTYLANVRAELQKLGITHEHVVINASHCHSVVRGDTDQLTVQAVKEAVAAMVPVRVGTGRGHEDRIMENRRLKMKDGSEVDMRRAYSMPKDEDVEAVGPVDPEIGLLRLDRTDGTPLALLYNFACHPIQGVPGGGNTADFPGFASRAIEQNLGENVMAFFVQGCAGDINPVLYKDVSHPRNAETLGSLLGISAMRGAKRIQTAEATNLKIVSETIELPRADFAERIDLLKAKREKLVTSLGGTSLNLKTFLPLVIGHGLSKDFPSYYSHRYLHDRQLGRTDYDRLDAENQRNMAAYLANISTMEEITRVQTNIRLLEMHQAQNVAAGKRTLDVELVGFRLGDFHLLTFPGELAVQIGLNLKKADPHENTFIAGYTNGYIYYAPTAEQLRNPGAAQEDCDTLLAPEWQELFEAKALNILKGL